MTPTSVCSKRLCATAPGNWLGFTLLEILLVLTLLGMASILVVPNLGDLELRTFSAQVRGATALLNYARRNAVIQGQPATVNFYNANIELNEEPAQAAVTGTWQAGAGTSLIFRDSTEQEVDVEDVLAIHFYPEGGSTGGTLLLQHDDQRVAIVIDPFTGRITTETQNDQANR